MSSSSNTASGTVLSATPSIRNRATHSTELLSCRGVADPRVPPESEFHVPRRSQNSHSY
ncbi:hypothetical protein M404DRAFT_692784 [Pisolithus tinctorius Marx 270]|uniref:Uncharacterized protein n=1 Tax=Pisolithus tinctorius Marx 270 TaxID=870435 RepID=A0A0C3PU32_PISTI|nr:hypothetical protein M404DRAFT_692784 [Pisolithus tinctorius Marx 270]